MLLELVVSAVFVLFLVFIIVFIIIFVSIFVFILAFFYIFISVFIDLLFLSLSDLCHFLFEVLFDHLFYLHRLMIF